MFAWSEHDDEGALLGARVAAEVTRSRKGSADGKTASRLLAAEAGRLLRCLVPPALPVRHLGRSQIRHWRTQWHAAVA